MLTSDLLTIQPESEDERTRLGTALKVKPERTLLIRCAQQCRLAHVAVSTAGIVFRSEPWEAPLFVRHVVYEDGKRLTRQQGFKAGYHDNPVDHHAAVAFLDEGAEPVDLLVRCKKHGDAVLERAQIMSWLREVRPKPTVLTKMPRMRYAKPTPLGTGEKRTSTFTRQINSDSLPLDELRKWLGWDDETPE